MKGFEKNPQLGKIFQSWGESVAHVAAKRRRRASGLARVSEMPYIGYSQEQIAAHQALSRRQQGEREETTPVELPYVPSPPIVPEVYVSEDDRRTTRLIAATAPDTTKAAQLSLF